MENLRLFIAEELRRRRRFRVLRRNLRDTSNPFELPENSFKKMFRLTNESAFEIFTQLQPRLEINRGRATRIPSVIKFIVTLHFLAQGSYQNSIGQDYRSPMSQSSVSRSIHVVIDIIIDQFHHIIKFPRTVEEITVTKNRFFQRFQLPGVVGCIDCTHVPISGEALVLGNIDVPRLVFMNRKGYFSLNCQIICDSNLRILHMGARFPGSVHDAAIWQLSDIQVYLRRRFFNNNDETTWLLGDSAYPLTPYLLTPINGADPNTPEGRYTYAHRLARNSIERCIGVLKTAWRCLHKDRVLKYHPLFVAKIFYTCGILHNIMRMRNIEIEIDYDMHNELEVEDFNDADFNVQLLHLGRQRRNNVIQNNFL